MTAAEIREQPAGPNHGRRMLGLAFLLSSVAALGPFSIDLYLSAMPAIGRALNADPGLIQMTLAIFLIGNGVGQLAFGPISDRFGRRRPAIWGLVFYIATSAGCALAASGEQLVLLRLLQAFGVCAGQVAARAVLADLFEPREMARFSSLMTMITMVAPIIGPLIGGFIFITLGWRPVFWTLALYGAAVLVAVMWGLPETRSREAQAAARAEPALASYLAVAVNGPLMQTALVAAFGLSTMFVYLANAAHILIDHFETPVSHFGWYFAANAVGLWLGAGLNRRLLRRREPQQVLRWACLALLALALVLAVAAHMPAAGKWGLLAALFLLIGVSPMVVGNATALAQSYDRARAGAVAALFGAMSSVIGFAAIALTAAIGGDGPQAMSYGMLATVSACSGLFLLGRRVRRKC